jgi:hypothetical protein
MHFDYLHFDNNRGNGSIDSNKNQLLSSGILSTEGATVETGMHDLIK